MTYTYNNRIFKYVKQKVKLVEKEDDSYFPEYFKILVQNLDNVQEINKNRLYIYLDKEGFLYYYNFGPTEDDNEETIFRNPTKEELLELVDVFNL